MDTLSDLLDMLKGAKLNIGFWTCPKGCRGLVSWEHLPEGSIATCKTCGKKSPPMKGIKP